VLGRANPAPRAHSTAPAIGQSAGTAVGLLLAVAPGRLIQGILFGLDAWEPLPLLAAAGVLAAVVLLASALPARRAAVVDPVAALRAE
jgi:ABC-type lipoprotein release transport system permease subunit